MIYYIVSDEDGIYDAISNADRAPYVGTNYELALNSSDSENPYIWTVKVNRRENIEIVKRVAEVEEF